MMVLPVVVQTTVPEALRNTRLMVARIPAKHTVGLWRETIPVVVIVTQVISSSWALAAAVVELKVELFTFLPALFQET